jgi:hypothetical protein
MGKAKNTPLIDDDGEARTPTAAEWQWFVHAPDFGSTEDVMAFLETRRAFLQAAEDAGFVRETFLPFDPNKPGFIERAEAALETLVARSRAARHAAE